MLAVVKTTTEEGPSGTQVEDRPNPKPGPDEILIRVAAAAICGTDKHIYHWDPSIRDSMTLPRIFGNAVHPTQICDLDGKSVLITGFGPIGAMAAAIAEHSGAATVIVTDVNDAALESARRWAALRDLRNFHAFNIGDPRDAKAAIDAITEGVGVDMVCEMSGAAAAVNFALDVVRMGGILSLLGLPRGHALTIDDYTKNVIFKGVTLQGIIGRRMYGTWQRMLSLLRSGLDVEWVVQGTFDSLREFHDGMARFDRKEALKVVFFPEGEQAAEARLGRR